MAVIFPSNPTNGQIYSYNSITYTYVQSKGYWQSTYNANTQQLISITNSNNLYKLNLTGY